MNTLIVCDNPVEGTKRTFETDNIFADIRREFPTWPPTARLYYHFVAENCDVTPRNEKAIDWIREHPGTYVLVVYPGDPVTISFSQIITSLIITAILSGAAYLLTPKQSTPSIPNSAERRIDDASPNNAFSGRSNQARINGRIPDIFGTVKSTPDLIAVPYSKFVENIEYEHAYMCIGRGAYDVVADDVKDGDTKSSDIDGESVEIYSPNESPNSGDSPQLRIGDAINTEITKIGKLTAVNGQVLLAANSGRLTRPGRYARFASTNQIENDGTDDVDAPSPDALDFRDYFTADDGKQITLSGVNYDNDDIRSFIGTGVFESPNKITFGAGNLLDKFVVGRNLIIAGATDSGGSGLNFNGTYVLATVANGFVTLTSPASVNANWSSLSGFPGGISIDDVSFETPKVTVDLDGTYDITSVADGQINLDTPAAVNSDWNKLAFLPHSRTDYISPSLTPSFDRNVGPFVIADTEMDKVIVNVIALSGIYRDNGLKQQAVNITLDIKLQKLNAAGATVGAEDVHSVTVNGSAVSRSTIAKTFEIAPAGGAGRYRVRIKNTYSFDFSYDGTTVDEIKWRDLYSSSPIAAEDFGNITTVQCLTKATERALGVKERKLSMIVSRKIPARSGNHFTAGLTASSSVDDILCAVALDAYIGRRTIDELDLDNIYDTIAAVVAYFGDAELAEFNGTLDKTGLSFEETVHMIAQAAFCTPYRRGNKLKLSFEKLTENSTLLFNHRNKLPKSEVRTYRFGPVKDFDGIELLYVDPDDDSPVTLYIPDDRSATAPRKIETIGLRNHKQPYVLAWREWSKMNYQNASTKFDALEEASVCVLNDRILVADNTRPDTMDGEIVDQDALILELSQPVTLDGAKDYTMHIQMPDGTTESFAVTQGADSRHVVIDAPPSMPLSTDPQNAVRAVFTIIWDDDPRQLPFLLTARDQPSDKNTYPVTAINYDDRYYAEDQNFPT